MTKFKSTPYSQKSLELGDLAYKAFARPVLPYFIKPYRLVSPYVRQADELGDKTLSAVDSRFPALLKPTGELYLDAKGCILYPVHLCVAGRDYILCTFKTELKKIGDATVVAYGKAALTTALILTKENVTAVSNYIGAKEEEAKAAAETAKD